MRQPFTLLRNNAGTYQLSADRRALMPNAGVRAGYRVIINTYKMAYRCPAGSAAAYLSQLSNAQETAFLEHFC